MTHRRKIDYSPRPAARVHIEASASSDAQRNFYASTSGRRGSNLARPSAASSEHRFTHANGYGNSRPTAVAAATSSSSSSAVLAANAAARCQKYPERNLPVEAPRSRSSSFSLFRLMGFGSSSASSSSSIASRGQRRYANDDSDDDEDDDSAYVTSNSMVAYAAPRRDLSAGGSAAAASSRGGGSGGSPAKSSSSTSSSGAASSSSGSGGKPLCCDACDGKHETAACPYFKKKRDPHRDAQKGKGPSMGGSGGNFTLKTAREVRQPGDGNCLFHSLAYGLGSSHSASSLRRSIAAYIGKNPQLEIAETPLSDWVKWDSQCSAATYASRIGRSGWGGGIEMAACSRMLKVNVHVYEASRRTSGYKRISCFDAPGAKRTIHLLYCGGVHYNALVV